MHNAIDHEAYTRETSEVEQRAKPSPSPVEWAWKTLTGSTAVVVVVGTTTWGLGSFDAETSSRRSPVPEQASESKAKPEVRTHHGSGQPRSRDGLPRAQDDESTAALQARGSECHGASEKTTSSGCSAATILRPANGEEIPSDFVRVAGTVDPALTGDLWAVVVPERAASRGWPQSDDAEKGLPATRKGSEFEVGAFLGGPPQSYEIVLYHADAAASRVFSSALLEWSESGRYPGLPIRDFPKGLTKLSTVTVDRK